MRWERLREKSSCETRELMTSDITLRDVTPGDLAIFFEQQKDPGAVWMVAFAEERRLDREAFIARWTEIFSQPTILARTILCDGQVAGDLMSFILEDRREVGYWLGREYWGRGIATQALRLFLEVVTTRPLFAHAAKDNFGSIHVLEKCGFTVVSEQQAYAAARGEEVAEVIMRLDASAAH